jgi:hypothetical protein
MGVLTKAQRQVLHELEQKAMADMVRTTPTYPSAMAGAALSGQIWAVLEALFEELQKASEKMPEQFTLSISSDILADVDSAATAYLATDLYRPRGGWSFSAKKRAFRRDLQNQMDGRALLAAAHLQRARVFLGGPK